MTTFAIPDRARREVVEQGLEGLPPMPDSGYPLDLGMLVANVRTARAARRLREAGHLPASSAADARSDALEAALAAREPEPGRNPAPAARPRSRASSAIAARIVGPSTAPVEAAAAEGKAQALRAPAVRDWKAAAGEWLLRLARGAEFAADDLVEAIGLPSDPHATERPNNVVGAWLSAQARAARIVWTGEFSKSARVEGHGNLQRRWRKT